LKRRPSILIYMRILELLRDEPRGPTRLAQSVGFPYDKFLPFLQVVTTKGLVRKETSGTRDTYYITEEGRQVFMDWQKVWEKLKP
jgi:predicted transcriptional regulator